MGVLHMAQKTTDRYLSAAKTRGSWHSGARQCAALTLVAKASANAPDPLASPLPKGNAPRDGGGQGAGESGLIDNERIIPRGQGGVAARLKVSQ